MNILFGINPYGRYIFGKDIGFSLNSRRNRRNIENYIPNHFEVIAYARDGRKTAIFSSSSEKSALSKLEFNLTPTGAGACTLIFKELPKTTELNYMQRIDIFLFGDDLPWYSGYILSRPIIGTTETEFKFVAHGYYNMLESLTIFETYENMDPGDIVKDIAIKAEKSHGLIYNPTKIANANYIVTKLVFDGVTAKEALNTLADFAIDFVFGVDEFRNLYFKPREDEINEEARFTVGKHLNEYVPSYTIEEIFNWARVKGGNIDEEGEQWLCTVEDRDSIDLYGKRDKILTLPSAYDISDARRWGENMMEKYKEPRKTARIKGVNLIYPKSDNSFGIRYLTTEGMAEIRTLEGEVFTYPITNVKYTISSEKGIRCDMTLGEIKNSVDTYLANIMRNAKNIEQSQATAIKQLKKG